MIIFQCNLSSRLLRIKQLRIFFFLCCYLTCLAIAALTPQEIASNAFPSVVVVIAQNSSGEDFAYGSGFFVAPDLVATNLHVIEGAAKVRIRPIGSETESDVTGFTAVDYDNDLVLLKTQVKDGKPLIVADDSLVSIGDDVYVIGNPQGLEGTFSKGMISGKRDINTHKIIQITAPISQGSSGGPVLTERGEVVGIAVAYVTEGQNLNFAVPSFLLKRLINSQSEVKEINAFLNKNVKKITPRDIDTKQQPFFVGNVSLYLGMSESDAKNKINAYYQTASTDDNSYPTYFVFDSTTKETVGSFACRNGKVTYISNSFGSTSATNDMVKMFKVFQSKVQSLIEDGNVLCIVDSQGNRIKTQDGTIGMYVVKLIFGDYSLSMTINESSAGNSFFIDETLEP